MTTGGNHYDGRGWSEYEKLVLYRLDDLSERLACAERTLVTLQARSSLWGALGGALTVALMLGIFVIKKLI